MKINKILGSVLLCCIFSYHGYAQQNSENFECVSPGNSIDLFSKYVQQAYTNFKILQGDQNDSQVVYEPLQASQVTYSGAAAANVSGNTLQYGSVYNGAIIFSVPYKKTKTLRIVNGVLQNQSQMRNNLSLTTAGETPPTEPDPCEVCFSEIGGSGGVEGDSTVITINITVEGIISGAVNITQAFPTNLNAVIDGSKCFVDDTLTLGVPNLFKNFDCNWIIPSGLQALNGTSEAFVTCKKVSGGIFEVSFSANDCKGATINASPVQIGTKAPKPVIELEGSECVSTEEESISAKLTNRDDAFTYNWCFISPNNTIPVSTNGDNASFQIGPIASGRIQLTAIGGCDSNSSTIAINRALGENVSIMYNTADSNCIFEGDRLGLYLHPAVQEDVVWTTPQGWYNTTSPNSSTSVNFDIMVGAASGIVNVQTTQCPSGEVTLDVNLNRDAVELTISGEEALSPGKTYEYEVAGHKADASYTWIIPQLGINTSSPNNTFSLTVPQNQTGDISIISQTTICSRVFADTLNVCLKPVAPTFNGADPCLNVGIKTDFSLSVANIPNITSYEWILPSGITGATNGSSVSLSSKGKTEFDESYIIAVYTKNACGNSDTTEKEIIAKGIGENVFFMTFSIPEYTIIDVMRCESIDDLCYVLPEDYDFPQQDYPTLDYPYTAVATYGGLPASTTGQNVDASSVPMGLYSLVLTNSEGCKTRLLYGSNGYEVTDADYEETNTVRMASSHKRSLNFLTPKIPAKLSRAYRKMMEENKGNTNDNIFTSKAFSLSPNPSTYVVNIRLSENPSNTAKILIYDMNARLVRDINTSSMEVQINTSDLQPGTYIVSLFDDQMIKWTQKLIISK